MWVDPGELHRQLTDDYRRKCDEELRELAEDWADLTEMAQQVLCDEMRSRGLGDPTAPKTAAAIPLRPMTLNDEPQWDGAMADAEDGDGDVPAAFTWKTLLSTYETKEEAWQVSEMLRRAGIDSWVEAPRSYEIDLSGPRVVVAADQLDQARAIAEQPVPQEIIELSKLKMPEFELPRCPACGAEDPVLQAVDPANQWLCEACGKEWTESAEGAVPN